MRVFEPNRAVYSKRKTKKSFCDFCDPTTLNDQEIKPLRTNHWRVLACKYPYMDGNLMMIPKRHVDHDDRLSREEWNEFPLVLLATQRALTKLFKTRSFNITLQVGPNSGGTIKHLHWMIIPRPKKANLSAWNLVHDFYFVTIGYKELKQKLEKILTEK